MPIGGVVRVDGERGAVIGVVMEVTVGNGEAAGLGAVEHGRGDLAGGLPGKGAQEGAIDIDVDGIAAQETAGAQRNKVVLVSLRKGGDVLGKLRHRGGGLAGQHGPALRWRVIGGNAQVRRRQQQVERGPFFPSGIRHAHMGGGAWVQAGAENPVKEGIGLGIGGAEVAHKRVIDPNREAFLGGTGAEFCG